MEVIGIALSVFNLGLFIAMVVFTKKYTNATERMVQLDEERKVWEIQPVVVPLDKVVTQLTRSQSAEAQKWIEETNRRNIGFKNIGCGIATITHLNCRETTFDEDWNKQPAKEYAFPLYLGIGEEFIFKQLTEVSNLKSRQILFEAEYSDIHGNAYKMSSANGAVHTEKIKK